MNSNENINKRKIKLIEDIDSNVSQSLNVKQKKQFYKQIVENIKQLEEFNETIDSKNKEIYAKNNFFETQTKLTIDETDLEIRELFLKRDIKRPDSDHYNEIIKELNDKYVTLLDKSKVLAKKLLFWEKKMESVDNKFAQSVKGEKLTNWCRVCYRRAVVPFHCCRLGYYCSYTHLKSDRSHFTHCKKTENLDNNRPPLKPLPNKTKSKISV